MTGGTAAGDTGGHRGLEALLDLVVFAPAGLIVSTVEEVPRLAARGRDVVGARLANARAVGRMTVHFGSRELSRRLGFGGPAPRPAPSAPSGPPAPTAPSGPSPEPVVAAPPVDLPSPSSLAIPGFDALSASQVVHRLDGLSRAELEAVRSYEGATRGRRTILGRIDQLLA